MSQATPACPDSLRNSSNFLSHDDFIVEIFLPTAGAWHAIDDRLGEPRLYDKAAAYREATRQEAAGFPSRVIPPTTDEADAPTSSEMDAMWTAARYSEVSCSQCGRTFGRGRHGFSACRSHRRQRLEEVAA